MSKQIRKKREDAKMGNIEKQYSRDFGVRSDKKLGNYLKEKGFPSLSKLIENAKQPPKR
ncbi:MAG: hypothetical protein Q7S57_01180 [bacterium]|nr:hypothetical protein [bacterium]